MAPVTTDVTTTPRPSPPPLAHKIRASRFLQRLSTQRQDLFAHWKLGLRGVFN